MGWPGAKAALLSGRSGPGAGECGVRGGRSADLVGHGTVLKYYCFKVPVYSVFTLFHCSRTNPRHSALVETLREAGPW